VATGYRHIDLDERIEIEQHRENQWSLRKIAADLGRSPSTLSREIRRNHWRASNENASYRPYRDPALRTDEATPVQYRAARAQRRADARAVKSLEVV